MAAWVRSFAPRWNMWSVRKSRSSSIAIGPDDNIEQRRQDIVSAVTNVDSGVGVVVLTDMFGGTPSDLAISIMNGSNIEVIAAVNLPMLIKLASVRETSSLEEVVSQAQDAGRRYICAASWILGVKPDRVRHAPRSGSVAASV